MSEPSESIAPARCVGIVGDDAERLALDARQRRHHAGPEGAAQLQHRAFVAQRLDDIAHVVDAQPVLRERRGAAAAGRRARQSGSAPWKYDRYFLATATASASSSTAMSTMPLGTCTLIGPTSSGANTPRLPPSIIAGPPMPIDEFLVAITTSQQPRSAALPAKQRPELMPTSGDEPRQPAEEVEGHGVEAGDRLHVDVARPAAAAFGEEDQRQALLLDDLEQPVLLVMVGLALGAGEHRVVVVRDGHAALSRAEQRAVDAADAGDQPVGRRAARSGLRACGACAAPRSRRRRIRRSCRDRPGRRRSAAPCAGWSCAAAPRRRAACRRASCARRSRYSARSGRMWSRSIFSSAAAPFTSTSASSTNSSAWPS